MIDFVFLGFIGFVLALGLRRPYLWVLAYIYIDLLAPQRIGYGVIQSIPVSLIAFLAAFGGWLFFDNKRASRFTLRQGLLLCLLLYCAWTTANAAFPIEAASKWDWVWKSLLFAIFLPLTLTTRLRFEGAVLVSVLSIAAIVISAAIKTVLGGGGYERLYFFVNDNSGLYESSTLATAAIAIIPIILWLTRHGQLFPPDWRVRLFAAALIFACLLIPIGTEARTGLVCIAALGVLLLRNVRRKFAYLAFAGLVGLAALPFLPQSYYERMATIGSPEGDQSASTRLEVWEWTIDYAREHPFGGGFDSYRANRFVYRMPLRRTQGNTITTEFVEVEETARAFHSSIFEVLGEQGWPGLAIWLWLHGLGLWQMERIRRLGSKRIGRKARGAVPSGALGDWAPGLAEALQMAQIIALVGSLFQGIAYQPFVMLIVALQCGLWSYCRRKARDLKPDGERKGESARLARAHLRADWGAAQAAAQSEGG